MSLADNLRNLRGLTRDLVNSAKNLPFPSDKDRAKDVVSAANTLVNTVASALRPGSRGLKQSYFAKLKSDVVIANDALLEGVYEKFPGWRTGVTDPNEGLIDAPYNPLVGNSDYKGVYTEVWKAARSIDVGLGDIIPVGLNPVAGPHSSDPGPDGGPRPGAKPTRGPAVKNTGSNKLDPRLQRTVDIASGKPDYGMDESWVLRRLGPGEKDHSDDYRKRRDRGMEDAARRAAAEVSRDNPEVDEDTAYKSILDEMRSGRYYE